MTKDELKNKRLKSLEFSCNEIKKTYGINYAVNTNKSGSRFSIFFGIFQEFAGTYRQTMTYLDGVYNGAKHSRKIQHSNQETEHANWIRLKTIVMGNEKVVE